MNLKATYVAIANQLATLIMLLEHIAYSIIIYLVILVIQEAN